MKLVDLWYTRQPGDSFWRRVDHGTGLDIEAAPPAADGHLPRRQNGPPGTIATTSFPTEVCDRQRRALVAGIAGRDGERSSRAMDGA